MSAKKVKKPPSKVIANNRRAYFDYAIGDTLEAGIMLTGTEVKALRVGKANLGESYAGPMGNSNEIFLFNLNIPEYTQGNRNNHEPKRPRKLLMHRREIERMLAGVQRGGMTIVALKLYFNDDGRAKVELALAKGKKEHDKRQTEKNRDWAREKSRLMKNLS
ncbi:MAG: SsrA-binding protein [Hyphomicrobiales bacterium]|nr:SsrA-binding protein SmpB [Hyphomicrobiales bacterium]PCJ83946.1 MAG: SsrA-binding protein [Hyphomicrobiales bacterium]